MKDARASHHEVIAFLREVTMAFDGYRIRALSNVTLEIGRGEVLGSLGRVAPENPRRCALLAGRLRPTQGKVKVLGRSPARRATRARIGYCPQVPLHNWPPLYAAWNSFCEALLRRWPRPRRRPAHQAAPITRRYGGLAAALLRSRELILLDAPFAGLTPGECHDIKQMIRAAAQRGAAVVLGSDSLIETREVCTRLALYDGGSIGLVGAPDELLANPAAIRWLARVLPAATSQRVLQIIRQETETKTALNSGEAAKEATPAASFHKPAAAKTDAWFPSPPAAVPVAADSVKHDMLAKLAKPVRAARPTLGAETKLLRHK